MRWIANCKYHRDDADAPTTCCGKSRQIKPDGSDKLELMVRLKHWLLAGYGIQTRAQRHGHGQVEPEDLPSFTEAELDAALPPPNTPAQDWQNGRLPPNHVRDTLRAAVRELFENEEADEEESEDEEADEPTSSSNPSSSSSDDSSSSD